MALTDILTALADDTSRRILTILRAGSHSAGELAQALDMPPSKLVASTFMLVRVAEEMIDGKPTEVWDEVPFTLKGGILSFETDKLGTFLLVLNIAGSSVG